MTSTTRPQERRARDETREIPEESTSKAKGPTFWKRSDGTESFGGESGGRNQTEDHPRDRARRGSFSEGDSGPGNSKATTEDRARNSEIICPSAGGKQEESRIHRLRRSSDRISSASLNLWLPNAHSSRSMVEGFLSLAKSWSGNCQGSTLSVFYSGRNRGSTVIKPLEAPPRWSITDFAGAEASRLSELFSLPGLRRGNAAISWRAIDFHTPSWL